MGYLLLAKLQHDCREICSGTLVVSMNSNTKKSICYLMQLPGDILHTHSFGDSNVQARPILKTESKHLCLLLLVSDPRILRDNIFKVASLIFFSSIWTKLINSNVIHNNIFIYYKDNHKCSILISIIPKSNQYNFSREFKR